MANRDGAVLLQQQVKGACRPGLAEGITPNPGSATSVEGERGMAAALTWLGFSAILAAPVLTLCFLGARWKWFGLGILSWVVGVAVKALLQWAWDAAGG